MQRTILKRMTAKTDGSRTSSSTARSLVDYLRIQADPATSSFSPLYRSVYAGIIDRLERYRSSEEKNDLLDRILEASADRTPLEVSLLLMAGVHRAVLSDTAQRSQHAERLHHFYYNAPSVPDDNRQLMDAFWNVLDDNIASVADMIKHSTVQTNETARGVFWLFPTLLAFADNSTITSTSTSTSKQRLNPPIHLVDLGCSAGLNLVAEQRRYALVAKDMDDAEDDGIAFGLAAYPQFTVRASHSVPVSPRRLDARRLRIASRNGCDLRPVYDTSYLRCFVWPDQRERMSRLDEGIDALQQLSDGVRLTSVELPNGLPSYLQSLQHDANEPLVIYNTYMTTYLQDKGRSLKKCIGDYARAMNRTVLWVQSEPKHDDSDNDRKHHWCCWSVHLWEAGQPSCKHWELAWTHPHAQTVDWIPEQVHDYIAYTEDRQW